MSDSCTPAARRLSPAPVLFWLILLVAAYFIPRGLQANPDSHLALTYAIVERHTVRIDDYRSGLIDRAVYCGAHTDPRTCQHYYTDKAPGVSLLGAVVYGIMKPALPAGLMPTGPKADRFLLRLLLTLCTITVPCAAFAASYWRFTARFVGGPRAMLVTIAYAFGSMALPFSMLEFSHALTAALLFWAFIILFHAGHGATGSQRTLMLSAGVLAGYAIGCEYPAAIIGALLGGYVLLRGGRERAAIASAGFYAAGLALGLLPAATYNSIAYGSPIALGYAHLTDPYYAQGMARGILGVGLPSWNAVWSTSFSPYRGLFILSPWLLLAAPGLVAMARRGLRAEAWLCGAVCITYFLFQAGYAFWDGGASVGPRHFLPGLPFLAFPVAFALDQAAWRRAAQVLVGASIVMLSLVIVTNPLFGDPRYVSHVSNPLVDQTLHDLAIGRLQNNWGMLFHLPGLTSLLPLGIGAFVLVRRICRRLRLE